MVRLARAIEFCTSLRYGLPDLSDEENRRRFGRRADQHGHNYRLEVTLKGEPDPVTGMVINLTELNEILEIEVMSRFDHKDLNRDTNYFDQCPPTPENFAQVIFDLLETALPAGLLHGIRLHQDAKLYVDVLAEAG